MEWSCLVLLVGAAFLIRYWGLSKMHFWDENVYLLNAAYINSGTAGYQEISSRPPLLSLLFAGAFRIWNSEYAAEAMAACLNALGPAFLYLAGRKLTSRTAAAIAALLLAFSPFFVGVCPDNTGGFIQNCNGHSLLTDCPALTLIVISFWLLIRALERQTNVRFACAGFGLAMTVLMRFGSLSSVGILALLVFGAERRARAAIGCAAGFLLGMAPYLCWSRLRYGGFFATLRDGWDNLGGPAEPFFYYLKILPAMLSWLAIAGLAVWVIARGRGLLRAKQALGFAETTESDRGRRRIRMEAFLWLWALGAMIFFSSLSHKEPRYVIPVAPPLLLLGGIGLTSLMRTRSLALNRVAGVAITCALIATIWPAHHRFDGEFFDHSESEEMRVSKFLKENLPSSTVLYANENYPDFAYYSGMTTMDLPESGEQLYQALEHLPTGSILIAYKENDIGDGTPGEPPLNFLDSDQHFKRFREFRTLVLYTCR